MFFCGRRKKNQTQYNAKQENPSELLLQIQQQASNVKNGSQLESVLVLVGEYSVLVRDGPVLVPTYSTSFSSHLHPTNSTYLETINQCCSNLLCLRGITRRSLENIIFNILKDHSLTIFNHDNLHMVDVEQIKQHQLYLQGISLSTPLDFSNSRLTLLKHRSYRLKKNFDFVYLNELQFYFIHTMMNTSRDDDDLLSDFLSTRYSKDRNNSFIKSFQDSSYLIKNTSKFVIPENKIEERPQGEATPSALRGSILSSQDKQLQKTFNSSYKSKSFHVLKNLYPIALRCNGQHSNSSSVLQCLLSIKEFREFFQDKKYKDYKLSFNQKQYVCDALYNIIELSQECTEDFVDCQSIQKLLPSQSSPHNFYSVLIQQLILELQSEQSMSKANPLGRLCSGMLQETKKCQECGAVRLMNRQFLVLERIVDSQGRLQESGQGRSECGECRAMMMIQVHFTRTPEILVMRVISEQDSELPLPLHLDSLDCSQFRLVCCISGKECQSPDDLAQRTRSTNTGLDSIQLKAGQDNLFFFKPLLSQ